MSELFTPGFVWGAATSACQVEGAVDVDGRTDSIWDHSCRWEPWRILNRDACFEATEHYYRFEEDLDLLRSIGCRAYRFSISWSRVIPEFGAKPNSRGLDFYERLVDACLVREITPWVTIYHWDLPLWLHYRGGWLNPDVAEMFQDFAGTLADRIGDRVIHWMTFNEPQCFVGKGLYEGEHAPFYRLPLRDGLVALLNVIRAHDLGVEAIRGRVQKEAKVGIVSVGIVSVPATDDQEDALAAEEDSFSLGENPLWSASLYLDPIFLGQFPTELSKNFGDVLPEWGKDVLPLKQKTDFLGLNIYTARRVRRGRGGKVEVEPSAVGAPMTAIGWEVVPECMSWGPQFYHRRYGVPIVITENGMAAHDWPSANGQVRDPQRVDYLRKHLLALAQCMRRGVPVEGYFHWSLLDNFEWAMGYRMRFGLVYVDYATKQRIPKDSAKFYRQVIETSGGILLERG